MKLPELLAPAGNEESLIQAINNGADAVYIGLSAFNARGNIENFNEDNLRACVKRAHLFGVKVFLTLNTLVLDNEIEDVLKQVRIALNAKVDAFIVQDLGLAYLLKNKFPQIELHASTQMGISNLEGAKFLKKFGYSRYVLARETSIEEIRRISQNLKVDLEYFVQGALCVSFSGNCYLCSLIAGASGNRGKCKQFCRLPVKLEHQNIVKEGYFLSTKDFCMLPRLKELVDSGISSLKIEGRARRPAYVAGAVKVYREALDNNYNFNNNSIDILKRLFNRGDYISGYFDNENVIFNKNQNHSGIKIGKVIAVNNGKRFNEITIISNHALTKGDALKFFDDEKEVCSLSVQDVKVLGKDRYSFTTTVKVPKNCDIHLIVDSALENELLSKKRKLKVEVEIDLKIGERAVIKLSQGENSIEVKGDILEEAKAQPLTKEECLMQISKMGDDFEICQFRSNIENVFMAKSQINKLRRDAVEKLKEKIISKTESELDFEEKEFALKNNKPIKPSKNILYFSSLATLEKYIDSEDYLVYNPCVYNEKEISEFCFKNKEKMIYLSLPVIADEKDINFIKSLILKHENLGAVANNYYALELTSPEKTIIGSNMNVANSYAVEAYTNLGYNKIVLTKENFDIDDIKSNGAQLFVESKIRKSLMHFKHCPFKENLNSSCQSCRFKEGVKYKISGKSFMIRRKRIQTCQFELVEDKGLDVVKKLNMGHVVEIFN